MIPALVFILFGLVGSIGGLAFLIQDRITADKKKALSSNRLKHTAVIGSICCHGLLILTGILVFQAFTLPISWLFILCALTVLSRIWNGRVLFQKVHWPHHLISSFILGGGLFFYLH